MTYTEPPAQSLVRCNRCRAWRCREDYYNNKRRYNGLGSNCKPCDKVRKTEPAYLAKNHETARRYREADPERSRAYVNRWHKANRERVYENIRRSKERNPEAFAQSARARASRRGARMRGAKVLYFTPQELAARLAYWGNKCWMCGGAATSVDHVKPLSKGGLHILANLRPACIPCNSRKFDKWPL